MGAPLHSHFSNDSLRFQEDHLFSRTGQAFFFLLLRFFLFFFLFFAFFFFFWNATAYFAQFAIRGYAPVNGQIPRPNTHFPVVSNSMTMSKNSGFFVSTA